MADVIQFPGSRAPKIKSSWELYQIGLQIINSAAFQEADAKSGKAAFPYDPISVAIMNGHYQE